PGPSTTSSTMPAPSRCRSIHCCRRATPRSDASPAPAPSPREKTPAPDAGRERTKQNADCTHEHRQHQNRQRRQRGRAPDRTTERFGLDLTVAKVQDYIDDGRLRERPDGTRNTLQTQPLIDAIAAGGFDAVFGGARRDEDKARAKERIISLRDEFGGWNPSS